jgi:hypothetical protein
MCVCKDTCCRQHCYSVLSAVAALAALAVVTVVLQAALPGCQYLSFNKLCNQGFEILMAACGAVVVPLPQHYCQPWLSNAASCFGDLSLISIWYVRGASARPACDAASGRHLAGSTAAACSMRITTQLAVSGHQQKVLLLVDLSL